MITSKDFYRLQYKYPKLKGKGKLIETVIGADTETYDNGKPFMYCFSSGISYDTRKKDFLIEKLFTDLPFQDNTLHITVYNLKYDSGALLYYLPDEVKEELWYYGDANYKNQYLEYIPHKNLKIQIGNTKIMVWDIAQYYSMSLDNAAKKYLNEEKIKIGTKKFTKKYVDLNYNEILDYCIQDAILCEKLSIFLIKKLEEFGIRTTALYSSASLSFRYFSDKGKIITSWRPYKYYTDAVKTAIDSYQGGKFEVTARGMFDGYEYDITSAYPHEIKNLADISLAAFVESKEYIPECYYAFIRCKIKNYTGVHLPFGILEQNTRIYPSGEFYHTITKNEYLYLLEYGVDVEIINGWFIIIKNKPVFPYAKTIDSLFQLKAKYKNKDPMLYEVSKRMLNSFYGKMVQCIEKRLRPVLIDNIETEQEDIFQAGAGFMPFYAAIITANCRLQVTRIQQEMQRDCIAVHTDSVITLRPIDDKYITGKLGGFELVEKGKGCIIACGTYYIGDKYAYKGFQPTELDNWEGILTRNKDKSIIPYPAISVESWTEAISKGHFDSINLFTEKTKNIDLNADIKRLWTKKITASDLLKPLHYGKQVFYYGTKPDYWSSSQNNLKRSGGHNRRNEPSDLTNQPIQFRADCKRRDHTQRDKNPVKQTGGKNAKKRLRKAEKKPEQSGKKPEK